MTVVAGIEEFSTVVGRPVNITDEKYGGWKRLVNSKDPYKMYDLDSNRSMSGPWEKWRSYIDVISCSPQNSLK